MDATLKATMDMLRVISVGSEMKTKSKMDLLESRIGRATLQPTLLKSVEKLIVLMHTPASAVRSETLKDFISVCGSENAQAVKAWLREYQKVAAMLCFFKKEDYEQALETLIVEKSVMDGGSAYPFGSFDIEISVKCLAPLAHGGDVKMGNATPFRRMSVLTDSGGMVDLPFYAGRAIRGQLRDCLADDFLSLLGVDIGCNSPAIKNFFGHILYEGGSLCSGGDAEKAMKGSCGDSNNVKPGFIRNWRSHFPALSALGGVVGGTKIIPGKFFVSDFRPQCKQWGGSDLDSNDLMTWEFGTNRNDDESKEGESTSMIFDIECLKAGTVLKGGIDVKESASGIERSVITRGLELLAKRGYIGAGAAVGHGLVQIEFHAYADPGVYVEYVKSRKGDILRFIESFKGFTDDFEPVYTTADDLVQAPKRRVLVRKAPPGIEDTL